MTSTSWTPIPEDHKPASQSVQPVPEPSVPRGAGLHPGRLYTLTFEPCFQYRMSTLALAAGVQIEDDSSGSGVGGECVWGSGMEDEERRRLT